MGNGKWVCWCLIPFGIGLLARGALWSPKSDRPEPGDRRSSVTAPTSGSPDASPSELTDKSPEASATVSSLAELISISRPLDPANHARLLAALADLPKETLADWYVQHAVGSRTRDGVVAALADQLARVYPERALEFAQGGDRPVAKFLAKAHPERVGEFLRALGLGERSMWGSDGSRIVMLEEHLASLWHEDAGKMVAAQRAFLEEFGYPDDRKRYEKYGLGELIKNRMRARDGSPEELVAWLSTLPEGDKHKNPQQSPYIPIIEKFSSPQAALSFFNENGFGELGLEEQGFLLGEIGKRWAASDPSSVAAWVSDLPKEIAAKVARRAIIGSAKQDPLAAKAMFESLPPEMQVEGAASAIAREWAFGDPGPDAVTWYLENSKADSTNSFAGAMFHLAAHDPAAISAHLLEHPNRVAALGYGSYQVFQHLIENDPDTAQQIIGGFEGDKKQVGRGFARAWAGVDAAAALEFVEAETDPDLRRAAAWGIVDRAGEIGWADTMEWAQGLEGPGRTEALSGLLASAHLDVEAASRVATEWLNSDGAELDFKKRGAPLSAISSVARSLVGISGEAAAEWVEGLNEGPARDEAVGAVSRHWARYDPVAMSEWLVTQPKGEGWDAAVDHLVSNLDDDPASAFSWALSVGDSKAQETMLEEVVSNWAWRDTEVARAAIEAEEGLSPRLQRRLLRRVDEPR